MSRRADPPRIRRRALTGTLRERSRRLSDRPSRAFFSGDSCMYMSRQKQAHMVHYYYTTHFRPPRTLVEQVGYCTTVQDTRRGSRFNFHLMESRIRQMTDP